MPNLVKDTQMVRSRWELAHAPNGLCANLNESVQAMTEVRLYNEYGDYAAIACKELRTLKFEQPGGGGVRIPKWTAEGLDWQAVAREIEAEKRMKNEALKTAPTTVYSSSSKHETPDISTPFLDDISQASTILEAPPQQIEWAINTYARRNALCHSGVERLVDSCSWQALADRLIQDLEGLEEVDDRLFQKCMRQLIIRIQNSHYEDCHRNRSGKIVFVLSKAADAKEKRLRQRILSRKSRSEP